MDGLMSVSTKGAFKHYLVFLSSQENEENLLIKEPGAIQKVENPYPISKPNLVEWEDHYQTLFTEKHNYVQRLQTASRMYKADKKTKHANYKLEDTVVNMPKYLKEICTNGLNNPDCYFPDDNTYNWYYTGGILDSFQWNGYNYLLHWNPEEGISINDLDGPGCHLLLNKLKNRKLFSLKAYTTDKNLFVTAREKHSISIYLTNINENFCVDTVKDLCNITCEDKPWYDLKLNRFSFKNYATCNAEQVINIRDVDGREYASFQLKDASRFCQMEYIDKNTLVVCENKNLHFSDERLQNMEKITLKLDECQEICLLTPIDDNYLYIVSTHDFIKFDIRSRKVIYKYTHLMDQPPHLISLLKDGEENIICLANQHSRVLLYDRDSHYTTPLYVPNIQDTYSEMQLYTNFFSREDAEKRLESSTIGLTTVNTTCGSSFIYTSNAAGDLFRQQMLTEPIASSSEKNLASWVSSLPKPKPKLRVTDLVDVSHVREVLYRSIYNRTKILPPKVPNIIRRYEGGGNEFLKALEDVWLEDSEEPVPAIPTKEIKSTTKVSVWLQSHDFQE